jgi:hypothetical protein
MNPEEQKIAIAEACGITVIPCSCTNDPWRDDATGKHILDYLNDLNAMHEAEKVLDSNQACQFANNLFRVMIGEHGVSEFMKIHATAAQRSEAFLKTLNLWKR